MENKFLVENDTYTLEYKYDNEGSIFVVDITVKEYDNVEQKEDIIREAFKELCVEKNSTISLRSEILREVRMYERVGCYYISHDEADTEYELYFDPITCEQISLKNKAVQLIMASPKLQAAAIDVINAVSKRQKEKGTYINEDSDSE